MSEETTFGKTTSKIHLVENIGHTITHTALEGSKMTNVIFDISRNHCYKLNMKSRKGPLPFDLKQRFFSRQQRLKKNLNELIIIARHQQRVELGLRQSVQRPTR